MQLFNKNTKFEEATIETHDTDNKPVIMDAITAKQICCQKIFDLEIESIGEFIARMVNNGQYQGTYETKSAISEILDETIHEIKNYLISKGYECNSVIERSNTNKYYISISWKYAK